MVSRVAATALGRWAASQGRRLDSSAASSVSDTNRHRVPRGSPECEQRLFPDGYDGGAVKIAGLRVRGAQPSFKATVAGSGRQSLTELGWRRDEKLAWVFRRAAWQRWPPNRKAPATASKRRPPASRTPRRRTPDESPSRKAGAGCRWERSPARRKFCGRRHT